MTHIARSIDLTVITKGEHLINYSLFYSMISFILVVLKYVIMFIFIYAWIYLPSNGHTMAYKLIFMIDPGYMQSIKQFRDGSLSVSCMTCLYICVYDRFEALKDGSPSVGCTCPKGLFGSGPRPAMRSCGKLWWRRQICVPQSMAAFALGNRVTAACYEWTKHQPCVVWRAAN
jgi:hypothetical protein